MDISVDIMDYLPSGEIFSSNRWIKEFSYITTEVDLVKDKIKLVNCIGGVYRVGPEEVRPTRFLCFLAKLVELHLENEIILKFLTNTEFKYLRVLGALYFRLVAHCKDCLMKYFEPLLSDESTICILNEKTNMDTILMKDFVLQLIDLETFCHISLPKMKVDHITAQLSPKSPSCRVLDKSPTLEKRNEEEHRESPSLDQQRPPSSSPPNQERSMSSPRRTRRARRRNKQRTDDEDHDHCASDQNPHLYTYYATSGDSQRRLYQSDHSRQSREHLFGSKTPPSRRIDRDRECIGLKPKGDLRDILLEKRRSRSSFSLERPETRDWYCVENRRDQHKVSNNREFYFNRGRQPAENPRQDRDSRYQTDQERKDNRDWDRSGSQSYFPSSINEMGWAETIRQRGFVQDREGFRGSRDIHDYLRDQSNPSSLNHERQDKSDWDNRDIDSDLFRPELFLCKDREEFAENQYGHLQFGSSHVLLNPEFLGGWDQQPVENRQNHREHRETGTYNQERDNTWDWSPEENRRQHTGDQDCGSYHPNYVCYWSQDLDEYQPDNWRGYGRAYSPLNGERYVSNYLPENQVRDHHQDGGNLSQPADSLYDTRDRPYRAGYLKSSVFLVNNMEPPSRIEQDRDDISVSQHNDDQRDHAHDGNDGSNGFCCDRDLTESLCDQPIDYSIHSRSRADSGENDTCESKDSVGTPLTEAI